MRHHPFNRSARERRHLLEQVIWLEVGKRGPESVRAEVGRMIAQATGEERPSRTPIEVADPPRSAAVSTVRTVRIVPLTEDRVEYASIRSEGTSSGESTPTGKSWSVPSGRAESMRKG